MAIREEAVAGAQEDVCSANRQTSHPASPRRRNERLNATVMNRPSYVPADPVSVERMIDSYSGLFRSRPAAG
jgi:hypothetical protein